MRYYIKPKEDKFVLCYSAENPVSRINTSMGSFLWGGYAYEEFICEGTKDYCESVKKKLEYA